MERLLGLIAVCQEDAPCPASVKGIFDYLIHFQNLSNKISGDPDLPWKGQIHEQNFFWNKDIKMAALIWSKHQLCSGFCLTVNSSRSFLYQKRGNIFVSFHLQAVVLYALLQAMFKFFFLMTLDRLFWPWIFLAPTLSRGSIFQFNYVCKTLICLTLQFQSFT